MPPKKKPAADKPTVKSINVAVRNIMLVYTASKGSAGTMKGSLKLLTVSPTHFTARAPSRKNGWLFEPERWPISGVKTESNSGWGTFYKLSETSKAKLQELVAELFPDDTK